MDPIPLNAAGTYLALLAALLVGFLGGLAAGRPAASPPAAPTAGHDPDSLAGRHDAAWRRRSQNLGPED